MVKRETCMSKEEKKIGENEPKGKNLKMGKNILP